MDKNLTYRISQEADHFIAQCVEVDVASDGKSAEDARSQLLEALKLYFGTDKVTLGMKYDLDELLAQMPAGTRFEEIDFGPPIGKEIIEPNRKR